MAINTGTIQPLTLEGIRKLVGDAFRRYPVEAGSWLNILKADKGTMTDREVATIGSLAFKAENAPIALTDPRVGRKRDYTMSVFAGGIRVSWEADMDDLYGFIRKQFGGLGLAGNETMNIETAALFNLSDSGDSGPYTGFDTLSLLNATHTNLDGTDSLAYKSNRLSLDISESALQTALIQFEKIQDAADNRISFGKPRQLVTTVDNMFLVEEILTSEGKPFTADNTKNVLKGRLTPTFLHYASEAGQDRWLILGDGHDLNVFMRHAPVTDTYDDKSTLSQVATLAFRFGQGFGEWRQVIGSSGV